MAGNDNIYCNLATFTDDVAVSSSYIPRPFTAAAKQAYDEAEKADWSGGVTLAVLLERINAVASEFRSVESDVRDSRVSVIFSTRGFRHYQSKGCIDSPERSGKQVVYGFRHFLQALLVRSLLFDRMPSDRIGAVVAGRSIKETKRMLFEGIEMVARRGGGGANHQITANDEALGLWKRIYLGAGVELHVSQNVPKLGPAQLKLLISKLEAAVRKNWPCL